MSSPEPGAAPEERCEFLEEVIEEVLAWQPRVRGGRILYLGPGRGGEVSRLAQEAGHVTFVVHPRGGSSVERKKSTDKVTYKSDDVTELSFPPGSFEMVAGAWVLSGLSDLQADDFLRRVLGWLVPEGHFVFREACGFHEDTRPSNSTLPRSPVFYCQMLHSVTTKSSSFTILRATSLQSYVTHEGDPTKLCFLAQRSEVNSRTRHAVDIRYSKSFILRMERLLGHTWLSTGGESTTREFCQRLSLRPGQRVLDVGCGSGGSPFFMSRLYGVYVHGIDLSSNMMDLAVQRQTHLRRALRKRVHFELRDILDADYEASSYDVIYSRNSIFHIEKKEELFAKLYRWLKPGGILFVTDYFAKSTPPSESCAEFSAKTCSTLVTISAYERVLTGVGFSVESRDLADDFCSIHQKELDAFLSTREAFLEEYSQLEFDEMVALATHKITLVKEGQITWASCIARKGEFTE